MQREITPPPSKRRKLSEDKVDQNIAPEVPATTKTNEDDNSVLRVYSWNINGIAPFLQTNLTSFFTSPDKKQVPTNEASASLRDFLKRHHWPHILCLQEIKIGRDDAQTLKALKQAVNPRSKGSYEPIYEVFAALPQDKFNARGIGGKGRVYGVASIVRGDLIENYLVNVRMVDWDQEGRFSVVDITDLNSHFKLSVWNVYAVNGTTNEYRDSRTGEVVGTRHDRKLVVHRLMMEECIRLEQQGWDVLIIGDLNVAPARIDGHPNLRTYPDQHVINRADFNRRFLNDTNEHGLKGVDVWRALRGMEKKFTYYSRGRPWGSSCDRVDLAITSRRLMEDGRIVGCEIWNTDFERGPSDHVPISVDVRLRTSTAAPEHLVRDARETGKKIIGMAN